MGTVAGWRQRLWQGGGMSSARGWQDGCFCRWQDEDMAEARREGSGLQAIDIRDRGREMGAGRRREAAAKLSATTITAAQTCAGCRKKQLPKTARPARRLIRATQADLASACCACVAAFTARTLGASAGGSCARCNRCLSRRRLHGSATQAPPAARPSSPPSSPSLLQTTADLHSPPNTAVPFVDCASIVTMGARSNSFATFLIVGRESCCPVPAFCPSC